MVKNEMVTNNVYNLATTPNQVLICSLLIILYVKHERSGSGVSETAINPSEFVCSAVSFRTAEAGRGRRLLFIFLQAVREMFKSDYGYSPFDRGPR